MKAQRQIASSALISLVILVLAEQHRKESLPTTKQLIAYGFVFFILSAAADFGAEWAGALGILSMVAITLERGEDALAFIGSRAGYSTR